MNNQKVSSNGQNFSIINKRLNLFKGGGVYELAIK